MLLFSVLLNDTPRIIPPFPVCLLPVFIVAVQLCQLLFVRFFHATCSIGSKRLFFEQFSKAVRYWRFSGTCNPLTNLPCNGIMWSTWYPLGQFKYIFLIFSKSDHTGVLSNFAAFLLAVEASTLLLFLRYHVCISTLYTRRDHVSTYIPYTKTPRPFYRWTSFLRRA